MADFKKELGRRIRKVREEKGLSQADIAKMLGVKRPTISQIEQGKRNISAEEISRLAGVFQVSTDILLDLEKEIEVVLEHGKRRMAEKKQSDVRINIPQRNLKKFKQVLLYILEKVGSKPNVGETVLYKLLYFIDFDYYEKYEEQLIGARYQKNQYGPTPVEFKSVVDEMIKSEEITLVKNRYFQYPQRKYLPLKRPDLRELKANEIGVIDKVIDRLSDMNANQISEYSHNDIPWLTTEDGKIIEYESVFYRALPYSVRDYES